MEPKLIQPDSKENFETFRATLSLPFWNTSLSPRQSIFWKLDTNCRSERLIADVNYVNQSIPNVAIDFQKYVSPQKKTWSKRMLPLHFHLSGNLYKENVINTPGGIIWVFVWLVFYM